MTDSYDYWDIQTGEGLYDYELETRYDEMLDEIYGTVSVAGYEYDTSQVLREVDPIAHRVGFSDWLDSEIGETITETQPEADEE